MRTPPGFQPGDPVLTRLQFQASTASQGATLTAFPLQGNEAVEPWPGPGSPNAVRLGRQGNAGAGGVWCPALLSSLEWLIGD